MNCFFLATQMFFSARQPCEKDGFCLLSLKCVIFISVSALTQPFLCVSKVKLTEFFLNY